MIHIHLLRPSTVLLVSSSIAMDFHLRQTLRGRMPKTQQTS